MMDELRKGIIEAATMGLRNTRRPRRKNPLYRAPTASGAAWSYLYGTCRALSEWATDENIRLAIAGKSEREDDQSSNIEAVRRCHEMLSAIVSAAVNSDDDK